MARYVVRVAALQAGSGHRVVVACPPHTWLTQSAARAGIETVPWPAARNPDHKLRRELRTLRAIIEGVDPAVVHLHSSKAGLAGRLTVRGAWPTVFQPHAWSFEALQSGGIAGIASRWERLAGRWADVIVAVSDKELEVGSRLGIRARIDNVVIPNPVDTDRFRPEVGHRSETDFVRRSLGLDAGPLAVCVGRLCRQKGQDRLLDAWPEVLRGVPEAQLVLVGDGPDRVELEGRDVPRVTFAGNRVDVPALFRAAQVVVAPSRWEGMSLAVLEALASARPVVATDVAGVAETVRSGAGAVVPQGAERALAKAVAARLADPALAEREGNNGRHIVLRRHQIATVIDALDSVYDLAVTGARVTSGSEAVPAPVVRVDD